MKKSIKIDTPQDGVPEGALSAQYTQTEEMVRWAPPGEKPVTISYKDKSGKSWEEQIYQNIHFSCVWAKDGEKFVLETGGHGWLLHHLSDVTVVDDSNKKVK